MLQQITTGGLSGSFLHSTTQSRESTKILARLMQISLLVLMDPVLEAIAGSKIAIWLEWRILRSIRSKPRSNEGSVLRYATEEATQDSGEWGQEAPIPG